MPPLKAQLLLEESLSAYFPEMVFTDSGITVQLHQNTHQLSVYRVILSHKYKAPVAKYGYVRTVVETADGDRVRYIKTNLLSEKEVVKLWHRYQSIRSGQVKTSCSCGGKFHM